MSLNAHDQRELDAIEHRLSGSDQKLALLLATFARLTADEEMPVRERLRAGWQRLSWDRVWLLLALVIGLALIAVAVATAVSSGGRRACSAWAAACAGRPAAMSALHGNRMGDTFSKPNCPRPVRAPSPEGASAGIPGPQRAPR